MRYLENSTPIAMATDGIYRKTAGATATAGEGGRHAQRARIRSRRAAGEGNKIYTACTQRLAQNMHGSEDKGCRSNAIKTNPET